MCDCECANPYDSHWAYRQGLLDIGPRFYIRTKLMLRYFRAGADRVLDIGCWDGQFLQLIYTRGMEGRGFDASAEAILGGGEPSIVAQKELS